MSLDLELIKQYCRIDYDDDSELLYTLQRAVEDDLCELLPGFDKDNPTYRQKLLIMTSVKDLYDNRDKYLSGRDLKETGDRMRQAVRSMLLKEMLGQ